MEMPSQLLLKLFLVNLASKDVFLSLGFISMDVLSLTTGKDPYATYVKLLNEWAVVDADAIQYPLSSVCIYLIPSVLVKPNCNKF